MNDIETLVSVLQRGKEFYEQIQKESGKLGTPSAYSSDFYPSLILGFLLLNSSQPVQSATTETKSSVLPSSFADQSDLLSAVLTAVKQLSEQITVLTEKVAELELQKPVQVQDQTQNQTQEQTFVPGCMHVGPDKKCTNCSEHRIEECSEANCDISFFLDRAHKCKNYGECSFAFCEEHESELSEYGYCDDCHLLDCDGSCGDNIENGTQHRCSSLECKEDEDYCDDCAKRYLDKDGKCAVCSSAELVSCSTCDTEYIETNLTKCKGESCENTYCPDCEDDELDEKDLCPDCAN